MSLERLGTANNIISGNYIGTNASGMAALGNGVDGICFDVDAGNNVIGGDAADERNIISGNGQYGIHLNRADGNIITGNYIGTNASGTIALRNVHEGILIGYSAENNTIGGDTPGERNVISGNGSRGVSIRNWSTTGNIISGNYIGTDATGAFAVGNGADGILVSGNSVNNRVERNVISGNKISGVYIDSNHNTVVDNYIGTDASGTAPLGNLYYGVDITAVGTGTRNNTIGPGNLIAHNVQDGVVVRSLASVGHVITRNSTFANRMGIDLRDGSNGNIAAPVIDHTTVGPGTVTVVGTACPGCIVELFENSNTDGEGETYVGYAIADGNSVFSIAVSSLSKLYLTATATDPVKGTSEFSAVYTATYPDLSASAKSVDKATVAPGEVLIYTITLINGGTGPATAVLTDSLPDEVTWENEYSASAGTLTWDEENRRLTWTGTVTVGTAVTIMYQVRVNAGVSAGIEIANTARVDDGAGVVSELDPAITTVLNVSPSAVDDAYDVVEDSLLTVGAPGVLANDVDLNADALAAEKASNPASGALVLGADGSLAYQPAANFCGSDAFTYTASDGHGGTASATVSVSVTCTNNDPAAADDSATTDEDSPVQIPVLANDGDADADPLTISEVSAPAHGAATINTDGTVGYHPEHDFCGEDIFSYTVSDGNGATDTANVAVKVACINDLPLAGDDSYAAQQDIPLMIGAPGVLANDSDIDGDALFVDRYDSASQSGGSVMMVSDGSFTFTPASGFAGADTFTYTIGDGHGGLDTATVSVSVGVANQPPFAEAGGPYTVHEGSNVSLDGSNSSDPDPGATLTFEWDLDYDGMTFDVDVTGVTPTFDAAGLDGPASRTVALRVTDNAGASDIATAVVTIVNVAPAVEPIAASLSPVPVGTTSDVSASFFDPCAADTHTAVWDWADGNVTDGVVADATVSGSHIYAAPGVYVVRLTVTDDDGGTGEATLRYVVVYDPNGGFVTGGGWILSPAGACRLTETCYAATGKATFGFVSKYKTGATAPTGNTEFQFQAGDLNFHSTSYEWLVISGAKAMYKGVGTINGDGEYRFILTGIDADINSHDVFDTDRFRIKIWYEDGQGQQVVVYDNGLDADDGNDQATTEIGGGSIVIHSKK